MVVEAGKPTVSEPVETTLNTGHACSPAAFFLRRARICLLSAYKSHR